MVLRTEMAVLGSRWWNLPRMPSEARRANVSVAQHTLCSESRWGRQSACLLVCMLVHMSCRTCHETDGVSS
jgi:hypothetical protein